MHLLVQLSQALVHEDEARRRAWAHVRQAGAGLEAGHARGQGDVQDAHCELHQDALARLVSLAAARLGGRQEAVPQRACDGAHCRAAQGRVQQGRDAGGGRRAGRLVGL